MNTPSLRTLVQAAVDELTDEAKALLHDLEHTDSALLLTQDDAAELLRMIRAARQFLDLQPEEQA